MAFQDLKAVWFVRVRDDTVGLRLTFRPFFVGAKT
jgi:hypothetical protein